MASITINVPSREVGFFEKMVSKMGWTYSDAAVVCLSTTQKDQTLVKVGHAFGQICQLKNTSSGLE